MAQVRVRFAPSPTGFFHLGSARTALFNWLYARRREGAFVLRVEDSDAERNTDEALQVIFDGMRWLGLDWDEGPDAGGPRGPYYQSERGDIHQRYLQRLFDAGRAYEQDGAVWFRLEGERYRAHDEYKGEEVEKVDAPPVVVDDAIRGRVERREERDFVLVRSNGQPVFHFVNVVDDLAMDITHVIRGEDHLSNTSRHVLLYQALGATPPTFAHIPLILKESGSGKMSKRDRGALIEEYRRRHFLPEAVRNYICLLGWNPKDDREKMPIGEIIENFGFDGIQRGNARFDERKLMALNTEYLRELPVETFAWIARPVLEDAGVVDESIDEDYLQGVLRLCQPKARALEELPAFVNHFFTDAFERDPTARAKISKKGDPKELSREILPVLESAAPFDAATLQRDLEAFAESKGEKVFKWFPPLRYAVSGQGGGPDLLPMLETMGRDRVLRRVRGFVEEEG